MDKRWALWAWLGSALIFIATWYKVQLDVSINEWFGDFYNTIQEALTKPGTITAENFLIQLATFTKVAEIFAFATIAQFIAIFFSYADDFNSFKH